MKLPKHLRLILEASNASDDERRVIELIHTSKLLWKKIANGVKDDTERAALLRRCGESAIAIANIIDPKNKAVPITGLYLRNKGRDNRAFEVLVRVGNRWRVAIHEYFADGVVSHSVTAHGLDNLRRNR